MPGAIWATTGVARVSPTPLGLRHVQETLDALSGHMKGNRLSLTEADLAV